MRRRNHGILGFGLLFICLLSNHPARAANQSFSLSVPHRCEGWFKKDPPEILPFQETLESTPLGRAMIQDQWHKSASEFVRLRYVENSWQLALQAFNREPFQSQSPYLKALLLSWVMGTWIQPIKLEAHWPLMDRFELFIRRSILLDPTFSSFDLRRLRQASSLLIHNTLINGGVITHYFDKNVLPAFDQEIEIRFKMEKRELLWSLEFPNLVSVESGRVFDASGKGLIELANRAIRALVDIRVSNELQAQKIVEWCADLQKISPINFKTLIQIYKIFISHARASNFSSESSGKIKTAFQLVVENWKDNPVAYEAGNAALKIPLQASELAEQSTLRQDPK